MFEVCDGEFLFMLLLQMAVKEHVIESLFNSKLMTEAVFSKASGPSYRL